ncbi:MAG TPA: ROK family protein [bacterium]|mgnify:FL=1|nr:ROK family protein [bacterium]HOY45136.1 ROK family protein [bacterium]HPG82607.1 ROK family protein [bacterium]HPM59653.1 ROK family protein [bacterium]
MRIGIDFGGTNVKFGLFDEEGNTLKFAVERVADLAAAGSLLETLLDAAARFAAGEKLSRGGLGMKGMVDVRAGGVINDVGAGNEFAGIDLRARFAARLKVPFAFDNDARAYAWGEWRFGAGRGCPSIIAMTLGTGVGCAAVIDGRLFRSSNPASGLLGGHMSIDRNGPECPCGLKGCLELYCSAVNFEKQLLAAFPELTAEAIPLKAFFAGAGARPAWAAIKREFIDNLAIGVINVMHAYGVNTVILGGGLMKSHEQIIPGLLEIVKRRAWMVPKGNVRILPALLEDRAACLGAAFLDE